MSKQAVYLITIVLCVLLQAGISPAISIMHCGPNFLLIPVLIVSLHSGVAVSGATGFGLGLLYDLMGSSTVGCMALVFTVIAFVVAAASESMDLSTPVASGLIAILSSLFVELFYGIVALLTSAEGGSGLSTLLTYSLPTSLYTAIFVFIALVTIRFALADDMSGMPTHLGERSGSRNTSRMKFRMK